MNVPLFVFIQILLQNKPLFWSLLINEISPSFEQNFAAQYDGAKGPEPGPGPMVCGSSFQMQHK